VDDIRFRRLKHLLEVRIACRDFETFTNWWAMRNSKSHKATISQPRMRWMAGNVLVGNLTAADDRNTKGFQKN